MRKSKITSGRSLGCALSIIVFLVGLLLCFSLIGIFFGIPLMILSLFIGPNVRKVWKCSQCGYVFDRG